MFPFLFPLVWQWRSEKRTLKQCKAVKTLQKGILGLKLRPAAVLHLFFLSEN